MRGMIEQSNNQPQDEPDGTNRLSALTSSKRRHIHSRRMKEYLQQQEQTPPEKLRRCSHPGCEKQFSSAPGLRYHLRTHAPNARHFFCDRCRKTFKSHNGLKYHRQRTKCPEAGIDSSQADQQPHFSSLSDSPPARGDETMPIFTPAHPDLQETVTESERFSVPEAVSHDHRAKPHATEIVQHNAGIGECLISVKYPVEPVQKLAEPRHRKMETCRRKMMAEKEAKSLLPPLPLSGSQLESPPCGRAENEPLMEFAEIAIQSPLLQDKSVDWDHTNVKTPEQLQTVKQELSSICDTSGSHQCPFFVWQSFLAGTQIRFTSRSKSSEAGGLSDWYLVEELAPILQNKDIAHITENKDVTDVENEDITVLNLKQPIPLELIEKKLVEGCEDLIDLAFHSQNEIPTCLTSRCICHHPFFVRGKGIVICSKAA